VSGSYPTRKEERRVCFHERRNRGIAVRHDRDRRYRPDLAQPGTAQPEIGDRTTSSGFATTNHRSSEHVQSEARGAPDV
jgi:hypothetical protein